MEATMADQLEDLHDLNTPVAFNSEEYEEITSDEVDRVVAALDALMQSVASENIRAHLSEAADSVYALIYDDGVEVLDARDDVASEAA